MLTLKEKMQLFKLAKKPRKQIKLRLQVITNSLNLPSLHKTTKQIIESSSLKQQNVIKRINKFKKMDKTRNYISQMARKISDTKQEKQNQYKEREEYSRCLNGKNLDKLKRSSFFIKQKEKHYSNSKNASLLQQFSFTMTRVQKEQLIRQESQLRQKHYSFLKKEKRNDSSSLMQLKNELSSLKNLNKICKLQLEDARRIERLQGQTNRVSKLATRRDQAK